MFLLPSASNVHIMAISFLTMLGSETGRLSCWLISHSSCLDDLLISFLTSKKNIYPYTIYKLKSLCVFLVVPQIICNAHKQNLQQMLKSACSHACIYP